MEVYHIFLFETKKSMLFDDKVKLLSEQFAQKYEFANKYKSKLQTNLFSVYSSEIGSEGKTMGILPWIDEKGRDYSIEQRGKGLDIVTLTNQFESMREKAMFRGTGNIQNMLNASLELITGYVQKAKKQKMEFYRYFFFDGQDYSLDLYDAPANYNVTVQEAQRFGVTINTEIRYINQTFSDESGLSNIFNRDARADIMIYFANGFQILTTSLKRSHEERVDKVKHLNQTLPMASGKGGDDAMLKALEIYDDLNKSEGLLGEKLIEAEQRREEILKTFYDMKKNLYKAGMTSEDLEYYNKAFSDFLKTCSAFHLLKIEMLKPEQEAKASKDKIFEMKYANLTTEIYKNLPSK